MHNKRARILLLLTVRLGIALTVLFQMEGEHWALRLLGYLGALSMAMTLGSELEQELGKDWYR